MLSKALVLAVIVLFIGASIIPGVSSAEQVESPIGLLNDDGPVGYWSFDEGTGATVYDFAGNNHGTIYGASYTSNNGGCSGQNGDYGLEFVRTEHDYVLTSLNQLQEQTISLWFKVDTIQEGKGIVISTHIKDDNTGNLAIGIANFNSGVAVVCIDHASSSSWWDPPMLSTGLGSNYDYNDNAWHHIAFTHDGNGNYELFVDGVSKDTYFGSVLSDVRPYMFGRLQPGYQVEDYWFDGVLDEFRIYSKALSPSEIYELYKKPRNLQPSFLFGNINNLQTFGNIIVFEAEKLRIITFSPFQFIQYSNDEKIGISIVYIGILKPNFIFTFCKSYV